MHKFPALAGLAAGLMLAQAPPGPALSVDPAAGRHPISPGVYGINFYWDQADSAASLAADLRATVRRWGGNNTSRYNWKLDVSNIDADWFFEVLPDNNPHPELLPEGSSFNKMMEQARTTGGSMMGTIPILGWLPHLRQRMCSFSVQKYGKQCTFDYWFNDCGSGIAYQNGCPTPTRDNSYQSYTPTNAQYITNDRNDASAQFDESFQRDWVKYLVSKYGRANQGGVVVWSLDNEPVWWDSTHRDIHREPFNYDEALNLGLKYAAAIKQADPTALVSGPIGAGWESFFFSKLDIVRGWSTGPSWSYYGNPVDRKAHGNLAFVPWYLQKFREYEQQNRVRLLDILDMHAYIAPDNISFTPAGDAAREALRLKSTRVFWDPNYKMQTYWVRDVDNGGGPIAPALVPRMRAWVDQYYPGTKTAITEYNWGAQESITGAIAQADILGIFGREQLDIGTLWGPPRPEQPAAYAFRIFRNYDGIGGSFGEESVQATTEDPDKLAIFAARRTDSALTILVLNKTAGDLSSAVAVASGYRPAASAQVWRYSGTDLNAIVRQPDAPIAANSIAANFPAYSMTLFVIPAAPDSLPVPKPVVNAITNVASYERSIAPGQMVVVWGEKLGPKDLNNYISRTPNDVVSTEMQGVRVLFDGVPAPMVYVSATQVAAVVPYFGAIKPATHVQVEYQRVRSDPVEVAVSPTAPGLFTADMSGKGQAAMQNSDGRTPNSKENPAAPGDVVILWATGEGVTDPPGVDGRLAIEILPKPVAKCTAEIGGLPAVVEYCGAAPWNMPGLIQINARIDRAVQPEDAVPVRVTIGAASTQDGVTMAVR